ncbi:hypothetical protein GIG_02206 [Mycoplasmopsis anatis 1340]|uniref:Uncharacterized protein n=1 Tax=Mycoplasmopsis anatis 1340 TaxID=1034808 RepID=F9QDD4_9BACT|nr:hypothetical protein GIG_02206 [Mycoplasmopsis anatis 1340]
MIFSLATINVINLFIFLIVNNQKTNDKIKRIK